MKEINVELIISKSHNPWFNLALEDYLFNNIKDNTLILYLWQNQNTVVIGKSQNAWKEARGSLLEEDGGFLARRSTGGGAVYHDLGNMCYSFIASSDLYDLNRQLRVILNAVKDHGISASFTGRNDISLDDGRKFSGNAFKFSKDKGLMHGTLLLDTDQEKMAKYLQVSKAKIQAKGVDSLRSRVANLIELNKEISPDSISRALIKQFIGEYGPLNFEMIFDETDLKNEEFLSLYDNYSSWDFRYGKTPSFDMTFENRFPWGSLEIHLSAKSGIIEKAAVYSDAMDTNLADNLNSLLIGTPINIDALSKKLEESIYFAEKEDIKNWLIQVL